MIDHEHPRRQLIAGLVGPRIHLYKSNPIFHANIRALADSLPLWVDGIAAMAEHPRQAGLIEHMRKMERPS